MCCLVNVVNFTTLIHGYCQKDDLEAALSLLDDKYLNIEHPDVVTYTTVIDALGKKGRIEEATEHACAEEGFRSYSCYIQDSYPPVLSDG